MASGEVFCYCAAKTANRQGVTDGKMLNFGEFLGFTSKLAIENPGESEMLTPGTRVRLCAYWLYQFCNQGREHNLSYM